MIGVVVVVVVVVVVGSCRRRFRPSRVWCVTRERESDRVGVSSNEEDLFNARYPLSVFLSIYLFSSISLPYNYVNYYSYSIITFLL